MAHEEALQTTMDSEEECDFSSEGGEDFDDDLFHLEEAAEETISKEWVIYSSDVLLTNFGGSSHR